MENSGMVVELFFMGVILIGLLVLLVALVQLFNETRKTIKKIGELADTLKKTTEKSTYEYNNLKDVVSVLKRGGMIANGFVTLLQKTGVLNESRRNRSN